MSHRTLLGVVLLTAAITYALRALPMLLFKRPFGNRYLAAFLDALPYALLTAMILPAIFYSTGGAAYPARPVAPAAAGAVTALALGYMKRPLPVVALAATAVAYLCDLLLA
ncbi:MAG: AzlD domain-containing protein [Kiritimatiellae bacterium]|nr:AzlD domain-containing protein [Kiritimatiellia bacterium]